MPFSVVIVICLAFLVLAIVGFIILFHALADAKMAQIEELLSPIEQTPASCLKETLSILRYLRL